MINDFNQNFPHTDDKAVLEGLTYHAWMMVDQGDSGHEFWYRLYRSEALKRGLIE